MEYTTRFTLVCHHTDDADALYAAFSAPSGEALEDSIKAFFASRKVAIYPPDGMGFDHCERAGLVIDAAFTSGSTHADEFIGPLSRVCHALHADLRDDEIARTMEYGFVHGKKKPPADVVALMKTLAPVAQLGRVGRAIAATDRAENDPSYALTVAIGLSKNAATVQALLEKGADPNSKLPSGTSCLNRAVTKKNAKIVQLLLQHGADPNLQHKGYPNLFEACRFSAPKIVDLLLQHGADPNVRNAGVSEHSYPIEIAIYYHQSKAVQSLLAQGAKTTGMPRMCNLLDLNAGYFHDNHSGHLLEKRAIFELLVQDPGHQADLVQRRDHLVGLLHKGFEPMHKTPKDRADFDALQAYMGAAT
ncbi:MAG: ankyrin repeat domain-containing protein [Acidovorax sp.]|nr:ankyrin repeat domain-containing protein [Acidovorax sp.]